MVITSRGVQATVVPSEPALTWTVVARSAGGRWISAYTAPSTQSSAPVTALTAVQLATTTLTNCDESVEALMSAEMLSVSIPGTSASEDSSFGQASTGSWMLPDVTISVVPPPSSCSTTSVSSDISAIEPASTVARAAPARLVTGPSVITRPRASW